jgi:hypothetical protein
VRLNYLVNKDLRIAKKNVKIMLMAMKNTNSRADRLLNPIAQQIWAELSKEYGPRALKRIASAGIVAFSKLPHNGRVKAISIANGDKDLELILEVIPDDAELEQLEWQMKQIRRKLNSGIKREKIRRGSKRGTSKSA